MTAREVSASSSPSRYRQVDCYAGWVAEREANPALRSRQDTTVLKALRLQVMMRDPAGVRTSVIAAYMGWAGPSVDHVLLELREKGLVVATGVPDDPVPFDAILWRRELAVLARLEEHRP
jgi:hypothetical protein